MILTSFRTCCCNQTSHILFYPWSKRSNNTKTEVIGHLKIIVSKQWTKIKYGNLNTILSIWSFKRKRLPYGRLMKHKYRIWAHQVVKQWEVIYWETYALVVNRISVMSLLDIASINELESISIEYVPTFTQYYIDAYVWMYITLGTILLCFQKLLFLK